MTWRVGGSREELRRGRTGVGLRPYGVEGAAVRARTRSPLEPRGVLKWILAIPIDERKVYLDV